MKTPVIIVLLIAACGYGAFSHFSAEDLKLAQLEKRKERAAAESAQLDGELAKAREELDPLKRKLDETIAGAPAAELVKARVPLAEKCAALTKELDEAKLAESAASEPPAELAGELAGLTGELESVSATLQKLEKESLVLLKYKAAEEAAMPASKRNATR